MKRFAAEHDEEQFWKAKGFQNPETGKKIAVVGGGPCGMTAAYYLKKLGHDVTVYEKDPIAGGDMAKGMPEFRIPGADVAKEIKDITDIGVKLLVNSPVENVAELKKDYDAVLVTIGTSVGQEAGRPARLQFPQRLHRCSAAEGQPPAEAGCFPATR